MLKSTFERRLQRVALPCTNHLINCAWYINSISHSPRKRRKWQHQLSLRLATTGNEQGEGGVCLSVPTTHTWTCLPPSHSVPDPPFAGADLRGPCSQTGSTPSCRHLTGQAVMGLTCLSSLSHLRRLAPSTARDNEIAGARGRRGER